MGRNWQPKHKYRCPRCGWTGKRTAAIAWKKRCPKCNRWPPPERVKRKVTEE